MEYVKLAEKLGFTHAVPLEELFLSSKQSIRDCCNPRQCPNYGSNWVCPPACGALEDCQKKLNTFHHGLLLQSVTDLTPPTAPEVYGRLNREHNLRLKALVEALMPGRLLALTSGGCIFCESCAYPNPCIHPELKMESLSAYGINVGELCQQAGLPFSFREDRVYMTALLLF